MESLILIESLILFHMRYNGQLISVITDRNRKPTFKIRKPNFDFLSDFMRYNGSLTSVITDDNLKRNVGSSINISHVF